MKSFEQTIPLVALLILIIVPKGYADESVTITKTVFAAQRAGYVHHDIKAYMSQWTEDAEIVSARSETAGQYDFRLNRKQFESARRMLFQGKPSATKIDFEVESVKIEKDRATLHSQATVHFDGGTAQLEEIYRLRKTSEGWKVFQNRWWLVQRTIGDHIYSFDAEKFKKADDKVNSLKGNGNHEDLVFALYDACRFKEAHEAAKAITLTKNASADQWLVRGNLAMQAGDADDTKTSFLKALSLDANVKLPPYAAMLKKEEKTR